MGGPIALHLSRQAPRWPRATGAFVLLLPPGAHATSAGAALATDAACGTWTVVSSPQSSSANAYLEGAGASAQTDAWAVGHHSHNSDTVWQPLFRHWNGSAWRIVSTPTTGSPDSQLLAVTSVQPRTVWA